MPPCRMWVRVLVLLNVACLVPRAGTAQLRAIVVGRGFAQPVAFVQDPAVPSVHYVVEQGGRIRVLVGDILQSTDFLDLSDVTAASGERGLLGLAFAPDYRASGRFFVNFTNRAGDTVVARFRRSTSNRFVADASSRFDLLWSTGERVIRQPYANHNGGQLAFGPDGYLYVGMGDGGSGDDPQNRAQDGSTLLGKMLRIDVTVPDSDTKGFRVPPDNPFLDGNPVQARPEIWAFGLRNPWRFNFDQVALGGSGALLIGDVGQGSWEEIDYEPRGRGGRNYGWRLREGSHPNIASPPPPFGPLVDPIFEYNHSVGFAVIGGYVYRGQRLGPSFAGRYFFADLGGRVWSVQLSRDAAGEVRATDLEEHTADLGGASELGSITSFGADDSGELYLVTQTGGRIIALSRVGATIPPVRPPVQLPRGTDK